MMQSMIAGDPEVPERLRELLQEASRFAEAGEKEPALKLVKSAQQIITGLTNVVVRARYFNEVGRIGLLIGALKEAEIAFKQVLDCPRDEVTEELLLSARLNLGLLLYSKKQFEAGAFQLSAASDLAAKISSDNFQEIALRNLGECYLELKDYERASSALSRALALAEKALDYENQISLLSNLGLCNIRLNKPDVAQRYCEQRLRLAQDRDDKTTINAALGDLGNSHALGGQYHLALDYYRRARSYYVEIEGSDSVITYLDTYIVKVAQNIGDDLLEYVSRSISEQSFKITNQRAKKQFQKREYPGDLKQDVLCALLALADDLPEILPFVSHINFHEPPRLSTKDVLVLVGKITRHTSDSKSPNPCDLYEAARYLEQIRRGIQAAALLERVHKGELDPDISGTGHGSYLLYLRSFVASPMMTNHRMDPWGDVDLEEVLASKLEQGPWPLIALGNPDVQSFGAGKITTNDETWRNDLTLLGKNADFVIVVPCATEGTSWEIEWVVINKFLKKTVFVMPPSSGDRKQWWEENWLSLQNWSRYLGLDFPDYASKGLFFALGPEQQIATKDYENVLTGSQLWETLLMEVLGQFLPSTEFLQPVLDALPEVELLQEVKDRGVDSETVIQEHVDAHVDRIKERIRQIKPRLLDKVSPFKLGILEKGLPPQGDFVSWPPEHGRIPLTSGIYTVWEGGERLMWVGATQNLFATLDSHAGGQIENDSFCAAVLNQLVLPFLTEELRLDIEKGVLPMDKIVKLNIRRNLRYRLIPMGISEARLFENLIKRGVLDAGPPQLNPER
jgi:tetratricopeptide (TPR) repeat protein